MNSIINRSDNLDAVRPYFPGVDIVPPFQRGEYVAFNRESGEQMRGKLF